MIVDSSVWIAFGRGIATPQTARLKAAIVAREAMTTDAVRLEVLAGETRVDLLSAALDGCEDVMQLPRVDVEDAAALYRVCRRTGRTVRSTNDCLIAAIAIRNGLPVLHSDRDYDAIAAVSELQVVSA